MWTDRRMLLEPTSRFLSLYLLLICLDVVNAIYFFPSHQMLVVPEVRDRHDRLVEEYLTRGTSRLLGRSLRVEAVHADGTVIPGLLQLDFFSFVRHVFFPAALTRAVSFHSHQHSDRRSYWRQEILCSNSARSHRRASRDAISSDCSRHRAWSWSFHCRTLEISAQWRFFFFCLPNPQQRHLLDSMREGFVVTTDMGIIVECHSALLKLFGYQKEEVGLLIHHFLCFF